MALAAARAGGHGLADHLVENGQIGRDDLERRVARRIAQATLRESGPSSASGRMPHVGPYTMLRQLAQGTAGAVYEARGPSGRLVAVKVLHDSGLMEPDDVERARFRREAELLAKLDHPNVVTIHAAALDDPMPYLVEDLLTGGSLQDRLRQGPFDMAGNIREWVADGYRPGYESRERVDPRVPLENLGAARGGGYNELVRHARLANRIQIPRDVHIGWLGFRVALTAR